MKSGKVSTTAVATAFLRALEQAVPPQDRVIEDPWARQMVPRRGLSMFARWKFLASPRLRKLAKGVEYIAMRDRLADDCQRESLAEGATQAIILAAGFDTAALRLQAEAPEARIFEVDHPATQQAKIRHVDSLNIPEGERPVFVSCDFERESLSEKLLAKGFNPQERTSVKWMGVSYYLTVEAISQTLSDLSRVLCSGSTISFDYWLPAGRSRTSLRARLARMGEPSLFYPSSDEMNRLLDAHGFSVQEELSMADTVARYHLKDLGHDEHARFIIAERDSSTAE